MNRTLSESLVELPVVLDLGLRITAVLSLAWLVHVALVRCNPRWRVQLWRFTSLAVFIVALTAFLPRISVGLTPSIHLPDTVVNSPSYLAGASHGVTDNNEHADEFFAEAEEIEPLSTFMGSDFAQAKLAQSTNNITSDSEVVPTVPAWLSNNWQWVVGMCWAFGVVMLTLRWLAAQWRIHRLLLNSTSAPTHCHRSLNQAARRLNLSKSVELRVSTATDVPFVAGIRHPTVVLPTQMADVQFAHELPAIFAHELTHIKSNDLTWMSLSQWMAIPLWFHPLSWRTRSAHSMACEEVADAVAAENVGDVTAYSSTLARIALAAVVHPPTVAALSMARSPEIMSRLSRLKQGLSNMPLNRKAVVLFSLAGFLILAPLASLQLAYAMSDTTAVRQRYDTSDGRILHFPAGYTVGTLEIGLEKESEEWDRYAKRFDYRRDWNWKHFGFAQGDVTIPKNAKVKLTLKASGAEDMSWVSQLDPNDIFEFYVFPHPDNQNPYQFGDKQIKHLGHLTGLVELQMSYVQVTGKGMEHLRSLQSLEKLNIYSPNMDNSGLKAIGKLTSLQSLSMGKMKWTDTGLLHLANLTSLEEINLPHPGRPGKGFDTVVSLPNLKLIGAGTTFNDQHLAHLKHAKALRALMFQECADITDDGLAHLAHVPQLEYLDLWHTNITEKGVVHLKPLQSLKRLNLSVNRPPKSKVPPLTIKTAAIVAEIPSLEWLDFSSIAGGDEFLKHICRLPNLTSLRITGHRKAGMFTDVGFDHLTKLKNLKRLSITGNDITEKGMESIAQMTSLTSLRLHLEAMPNSALAQLRSLTELERLDLSSSRKTGLEFSGLSELNGFKHLKYLTYYCKPPLPDDRPLDLSLLPNLEDLMTAFLRDDDFAGLTNCTQLQRLQTGNQPNVSDAALVHIAKLKNLELLGIDGDGLTDEGLRQLEGLHNLEFIRIAGDFSDDGLYELAKMKSLGSIQISTKNTLSDDAIQHLKANLPSLWMFNIQQNRTAIGETPKFLRVGKDAPSFNVTSLDGKDLSLQSYRGKVVLLYFWSTNCKPCVASVPKMKKAYAELRKYNGFEMLSLSGDDNDAIVKAFSARQQIPWPQARIGDGSTMANEYGVTGFPSYVLIGRDGKILSTGKGLDAALRKALDVK